MAVNRFWQARIKQSLNRRLPVNQRERRIRLLQIASILLIVAVVGFLMATAGVAALFAWYSRELPRPDRVQRVEGLSTIVYDRHGTPLYNIYEDENRIPVKFAEIPEALKQATIAIEDKDFYRHPGISTMGILRAFVNIVVFRNFQGGSTLTQQLVKMVLLTNEQTLPRKIKEAILAAQIERKYTKDEILTMYLNEAPYGGPAVGIEAAAQYYFGKKAKDLTFVESIILSGLPQSPSQYNPYTSDDQSYIWRAEQVLRRMREDGYITAEAEADAKSKLTSVTFGNGKEGIVAPHFVAYVKNILEEELGSDAVERGGLRVTTTLDLSLQEKAEAIVAEEVDKLKTLRVSNGAAVVIDPKNGDILAMVGSKDYNDASDSGGFKFNVVTQGLRQPGSTLKPITVATAFKKGYTPSTVLMDVDTKYPSGDVKEPEYNPKNYDGKYRGLMSIRTALGNSINTVAVKLIAMVGVTDMLTTAHDMGLSTLEPTKENLKRFGLSVALGGGEVTLLELTQAYGVLANKGMAVTPRAILSVSDLSGSVVYEDHGQQPRRVLTEDVSFLVSSILSDNSARREVFGERSLLVIPNKTVAVKTGTTDDKRDNWAVGYTPSVVIGTWVGNNDNSPMHPSLASGVTGASPIWNRLMREVLAQSSDEAFVKPDGVVEVEVDAFTGGLPYEDRSRRKEFFIKGTEPNRVSPIYKKVKVSKKDANKLANPIDIAKGEYDEKLYYDIQEKDPVSTDGKNRWQEGIDAWIQGQSDALYKIPKDTASASDAVVIIIKEPGDGSRINSNNVRFLAEATAEKEIKIIELYLNDALYDSRDGKVYDRQIEIPNGSHKVRMKAIDVDGRSAERTVKLGINQDYAEPSPSPTP